MNVTGSDIINLTYERMAGNTRVRPITVSVSVIDAATGAQLLAPTTVPEVGTSGVYTYPWTHGLIKDTIMIATYSAMGRTIDEPIQFTRGSGGRGV